MLYGGGSVVISTSFIDGETPTGAIDGVNAAFTLSSIPSPGASLTLFRNGVEQVGAGIDYNIISNAITFIAASLPQVGDNLQAFYRSTNQTFINASFTDNETPVGLINGLNTVYTLASAPTPAASLQLYRNGDLMKAGGIDYTLVGLTITFVVAPALLDTLVAYYRQITGVLINPVFMDLDIPVGLINGVNAVYTLQASPSPAASLKLFKNGILMTAGGVDYALAANQITYIAAATPQLGDTHFAYYRR